MKKIFLRSFLLAIVFILLKPPKSAAQPFCPMWVYNDAQKVGIANDYIWSTFQEGFYYVTVLNTNFSTGDLLCFGDQDQLVQITKTTSMGSVISGATFTKGIIFNFSVSPCGSGIDIPNLRVNSTSIVVRQVLGANPILAADFNENDPSTCEYIVIPVTFGYFNADIFSPPTRAQLDWSTYSESNVDHFSIEASNDAVIWSKIGQVAAVGNSSTPNYYTYNDLYPTSNTYYRIVSVDIDCRRMYSLIRRVQCSFCPATSSHPAVPADCPPPQPYISGASVNCNYAKKIYKLNGIRGDIRVTWSLSPSYLANLTQANRLVGLTPANIPGNATLTATVVKNGVTSYYNYNIAFGLPQIYAFNTVTPYNVCTGYGQLTATVSMLPGTHPWEYTWYQNGGYIGSGDSHTWLFTGNQLITYEVRYNGPCGTSYYYGSSNGGIDPFKGNPKPEPNYQVAPNPAHTNIVITRKPPCPFEPPGPQKGATPKLLTAMETVIVKVYDMSGNIRKTTKVNRTDTRIEIRAGDLQTGWYYIEITEAGREGERLKVWLEK